MNEDEFTDKVLAELNKSLAGYKIGKGKNLLYKLLVDSKGELQPSDYAEPKRGQLAFQTDLLIRNDKVPLVAIEVKYGNFSTHDVLTYSTKAMKHKEVYPYLRYGLVIGDKHKIDKRFFTHNAGFDFAVAMGSAERDMKELIEIVKKEVSTAELLLNILEGKDVRRYVENVEIE